MAGFTLTSSSFADGGAIPMKHSCDGQSISPALAWAGAPTGTTAFALIVEDPDANGFVHWVAYNIVGARGNLPEAVSPAGPPPQGRNGTGQVGWAGPCPPSGTHHYRFTLYALSQPLALTGAPSANEVRAAVTAGVLLGQTTLIGLYTRQS